MQYTHAEKENKRYWSLVLLLVNARYIHNDQLFPIQTSHAIVVKYGLRHCKLFYDSSNRTDFCLTNLIARAIVFTCSDRIGKSIYENRTRYCKFEWSEFNALDTEDHTLSTRKEQRSMIQFIYNIVLQKCELKCLKQLENRLSL